MLVLLWGTAGIRMPQYQLPEKGAHEKTNILWMFLFKSIRQMVFLSG